MAGFGEGCLSRWRGFVAGAASRRSRRSLPALLLTAVLATAACGQAAQPSSGGGGSGGSASASTSSGGGAGQSSKTLSITMGTTSESTSAISFIFQSIMLQMPQFFQKAGIHVTTEAVQMGQAVQLVQGASPPVIEGSGQATVAAGYVHGATAVKIFAGQQQKPAYFMVVRKGISSINQVKTLGVPSVDSASAEMCEAIMRAHHLTLNKDYSLVLVGTSGARIAAVLAGKVDGSCELLPYPQWYHDKYGMTIMANAAKFVPYYSSGVWIYNTKWAQAPAHHEALVRLAEAIQLASQWAFDPANKSKVEQLAFKTFKKVPMKYIDTFYNAEFVQQILTPDGYVPKQAAMGNSEDIMRTGITKTVPAPGQYYNWTILEQASKLDGVKMRTVNYGTH